MVACARWPLCDPVSSIGAVQALSAVRSEVRAEDFNSAAGCSASVDAGIGGDQGDVKGFGQGDILRVVGGQVGVQALDARPQRKYVVPLDGERAVIGQRRVGFLPGDLPPSHEAEQSGDDLPVEYV